MKKIISLFCILILLTGCSTANISDSFSSDNVQISSFDIPESLYPSEKGKLGIIDFYNEFAKTEGNFVISPYSIFDSFSILYPAAEPNAKDELDNVFNFDNRNNTFYEKYNKYINSLKDESLVTADRIFINSEAKINQDLLNQNYIEEIDINENTATYINNYIQEHTNGKISSLVPSDAIYKPKTETNKKEKTSIVVVDTLYFNKQFPDFDESSIKWEDGKKYVAFSDTLSTWSAKEANDDIDVLRLSYKRKLWNSDEHRYAMYIICNSVDSEEKSVERFLASLSEDELNELLDFDDYSGLTGYSDAFFTVPNFEFETLGNITAPLKNLGLSVVFDKYQDPFYELATNPDETVVITDIYHGAYIKTDKTGTEAAAATAVTGTVAANAAADWEEPLPTKYIKADREFAFFIKDDTEDVVLFMGRVSEPSEKN